MLDLNRKDIFEAAPTAEEELYQEHMTGFVNTFIIKPQRERWLYYLSKRPKRLYDKAHDMYGDLDKTKYSVVKEESSLGKLQGEGIYYGYFDVPKIMSVPNALLSGALHDAIFSLAVGKTVILFSHEDMILLCQA